MIIKDKSIYDTFSEWYQKDFQSFHENEREHIRQFWKVIEEARIAALPYPNPINRKQRRANIAQERK